VQPGVTHAKDWDLKRIYYAMLILLIYIMYKRQNIFLPTFALEVDKISYKHPPILKESIDITFIENGEVVFKSNIQHSTSYMNIGIFRVQTCPDCRLTD